MSHCGNSHNISNSFIVIFGMVICDHWCYIVIVLGYHELHSYEMVNLISKYCVCSDFPCDWLFPSFSSGRPPIPWGKWWMVKSHLVVSYSLWPHGHVPGFSSMGLQATGVGCHFLLQEIFSTQGLNPGLLHCRLYHFTVWATREVYSLRHSNIETGPINNSTMTYSCSNERKSYMVL